MTLPNGVTTCTITIGKAMGILGTEGAIQGTVSIDRSVVHAATGDAIYDVDETFESGPGNFATFAVPHVDQPGFVDQSGNAVTEWAYVLTATVRIGGRARIVTKNFQPRVGQSTIDIDLVPGGSITPGVTAPGASVLAVAGRTGVITPEELLADLEPGLSATIATGVAANSGISVDPVAAAVKTLDRTSRSLALDAVGRADTLWIPAQAFLSSLGAPTLSATGGGSRFPVWLLDAATQEQITVAVMIPPGWERAWADLYYTNVGAGSGSATFSVTRSAAAEGGDLATGDVTNSFTDVAPAQNVVKRRRLFSSVTPFTPTALGVTHFRIYRDGPAGGDTLGNDVGVLGIMLRRAMPSLRLTCDGNSLTVGQGSTGGLDYPQQLKTLLTEPDTAARVQLVPTLENFGVGGQTTAQMASDAATQLDATLAAAGTYAAQVLLAWEVTNHLWGGASVTTAYEAYRDYLIARRTAGWRAPAFTVLPRSNTGTPTDFEAKRQQVNALIRNNWYTFADGLVDVAADPRIGYAGAELDTTYYNADKVHMTNAGYAVVAALVAAAVQRLTGGN